MSKPFTDDDADLPPEPSPLDDDLPPPPAEPSLRSSSHARSAAMPAVSSPQSAAPAVVPDDTPALAPAPLAKQLLGSAEQSAGPSLAADGDVLTVAGARYRITQRLGAGGMGEVFLARKLGTGGFERDVALKTVLPALAGHPQRAEKFLKGFVDEARLAAALHHPGICQVYDLQPLPARGLLQVLEYIPGHSLKTVLETARKKRASLTEPFACFVARELAAALDYAHHATDSNGRPLGIVHRDVTPHNVMISSSGNVKLLDFGIAFSALDNREATTSNMVKGKDQYYAPEQLIGGALDGRTDQFALGLCLYEMLVLKRFFGRSSTDTETALHLRIAQLTPESVEGALKNAPIDPSLKAILQHALAPVPDERFTSCAEFADALQAFSQRRGWLYTAADARKELDALLALPDSPDADKTNPSGKRVYSVAPRHVPKQTVPLPQLTPGRSVTTPPAPPTEASRLSLHVDLEPADGPAPEPSASLKPSLTAQKRRAQVQEALHNPKTSARKMLALPLAVLAGTLVLGIVLVKMLVLSSPSGGNAPAVEVLKTPEQLRAEREAEARATTPAALPPPELAPAPTPVAAAEPPPQPTAAPSKPARSTHRSKDAKAVDDLLAKQYGRPVVTPEAPQGATAPTGTPRRSLDTVMIADAPAAAVPGAGPLSLPRGTVLPARLTAPADTGQAGPVTATVTADVKVAGAVVVPKGATLICTSSPGARLALACDTLTVGRVQHVIDGIAFGADKRVGLPLPRTATPGPAGDAAKDNAVALGRTLLGRVTPEGPAGDVVNAAGNTASTAAGSGASSPAAAPLLPAGTAFTVFLQSSTQ